MTTNPEIKAALSSMGETIGAVTFWSLRGVHAKREELRTDLASLGLVMPKDPKPQVIIRYALESARRRNDEPVVYDRVSENKTEIVYAISTKGTDEANEQALYKHKTRCRLDKATGALTLEDPPDHTLQVVRDRYDELQTYASVAEVGTALMTALVGRARNIGLGAINLRGKSGGVYFVPEGNAVRLNALAQIMDRVAGYGAMTVWPIPVGGDRTIRQVDTAVREDFMDQIARTKLATELFIEELQDRPDATDRQVDARAVAFAQLRARADLFGDLLGEMRADLLEQVRQMEALVETRIGRPCVATVAEDADEEA